MVDIQWDMKTLDLYAMDLHQAPAKLLPELTPIIKRTMQEAKNGLQADFARSRYKGISQIQGKISYTDPGMSGAALTSKIGIDKGGAGSLGNIAVFGTWKGGGTHLHPTFYVRQALPGATSAIQEAIARALKP